MIIIMVMIQVYHLAILFKGLELRLHKKDKKVVHQKITDLFRRGGGERPSSLSLHHRTHLEVQIADKWNER